MVTEPPGAHDFAAWLRRLRAAASLTQEELAERAGLSSNAIGALERGERRRPAVSVDEADARPAAAATTSLLGRNAELDDVLRLLRSGRTRLVTVTGPGGVGKTRFALAVADALAAEFHDEVAVVELASIHDAGLVLPTVARTLGLRHGGGDGLLQSLSAHLRDRQQLLVLDNVEHLLAAAPDVGALVAGCPTLVVLATSRAPLRVRAEQDYPLTPLPLPETSDLADVAASPAARLFLDRARAVAPTFLLTQQTASAVAAICRRLDGLPLAMELAAAHARFLEPRALLARLDQAVSSPRARDLPKRQATMRATLDWSFDLLTADEQTLLIRLSVFAGGCRRVRHAQRSRGPVAGGAGCRRVLAPSTPGTGTAARGRAACSVRRGGCCRRAARGLLPRSRSCRA